MNKRLSLLVTGCTVYPTTNERDLEKSKTSRNAVAMIPVRMYLRSFKLGSNSRLYHT